MQQSLGGQQKRNNSEFLPIALLTLTGIVQASGKKQHILASVVLYSPCVRACVCALINNRQQNETGVCHSVLQRRDRS